jgi:hypothetical protein
MTMSAATPGGERALALAEFGELSASNSSQIPRKVVIHKLADS